MPMKFSIDSIEYFAEKFTNTPSLSYESLGYLSSQISEVISQLLQDAFKIQQKCRRKCLTTDDFTFALKFHRIEPLFGSVHSRSLLLFRKIKKDNRILYQIDDNILSLKDIINEPPPPIPLDLTIRTHWLAIDGKQPQINENPTVDRSIQMISQKKSNKNRQLLAVEQDIYYKEITEMCVCPNEQKRQQALLMLSTDPSVPLIFSRLVIFISEGIRVNIATHRSIILKYLLQMIEALLQNELLFFEPYLHFVFPSILSCLLNHQTSSDHWSLRDQAAKSSSQILRKFSSSVNCLQQRTINILYRILNSNDYTLAIQYGAFIGLCEINHKVIIEIVFPLIKRLGERIRQCRDEESVQKFTEIVLKFILLAYRSNEYESEKKFYEDFGSYFAPLVQQQLILLL